MELKPNRQLSNAVQLAAAIRLDTANHWQATAETISDGCRRRKKHLLSELDGTPSQYGPVYTCQARDGLNVGEALSRALTVLAGGIRMPVPDRAELGREKASRIVVGTAADGATVKEGSYVLIGDLLRQVQDGAPMPVA